jgi:hypothetical protein
MAIESAIYGGAQDFDRVGMKSGDEAQYSGVSPSGHGREIQTKSARRPQSPRPAAPPDGAAWLP